jgi:hypothetical protein
MSSVVFGFSADCAGDCPPVTGLIAGLRVCCCCCCRRRLERLVHGFVGLRQLRQDASLVFRLAFLLLKKRNLPQNRGCLARSSGLSSRDRFPIQRRGRTSSFATRFVWRSCRCARTPAASRAILTSRVRGSVPARSPRTTRPFRHAPSGRPATLRRRRPRGSATTASVQRRRRPGRSSLARRSSGRWRLLRKRARSRRGSR